MPVQLDTKVKRKCFGFGNKIRIEELPDGTTTEDFQDWNLTFGCARAPRARERERESRGARAAHEPLVRRARARVVATRMRCARRI
jgi:hypothetical protein